MSFKYWIDAPVGMAGAALLQDDMIVLLSIPTVTEWVRFGDWTVVRP